LCRCTGYLGIKAACHQLTAARQATGDGRQATEDLPPIAYRLEGRPGRKG
jgi:xanthine dehydrogenase iron-sulfur cluster and FAD-binding subunit A